LRYLERRLDRPVQLIVPRDYHSMRAGLADGRYHVAYLPPLQYVLARHQDPRLKAALSPLYEGARSYQAMLMSVDGSGVNGPADLRGRRICYVDPESTSGHLLVRDYLRRQGMDPDHVFSSVRFSGNHLAVVRDLLAGRCDVGALYGGAQLNATQQGLPTSRLRVVVVTGQLPFDVLCAAPSLPAELWQRLNRALLELDPPRHLGRPIVGPTYRISGFTVARPEDFRDVERAARSEGLLR
jgi:phosphonate transport system substrate-binding protein